MAKVMVCDAANYDAQTMTCSAPEWADAQTSLLPPLSATEGATIGSAIVLCWAIGWGARLVIRAVRT